MKQLHEKWNKQQEKLEKHESQTDGSKGFGGKFGVQTDRIDKVPFMKISIH